MATRPVFTVHAWERLADHGITDAEVYEALDNPTKRGPGRDGCVLVWGYAKSGRRVRVTLSPDEQSIVTVSNAGWRA